MSQFLKKCINNRVTCYNNVYKCNMCNCIVNDNVEKHFLTELHQEKLNQICKIQRKKQSASLKGLLENDLKKIVENSTFFQERSLLLTCCICNCTISGLPNTLQHVNGGYHAKQICNYATERKNNFKVQSDKLQETVLHKSINYRSCFSKVGFCQQCCICLENNTVAQCHVMLHLVQKYELLNKFDIIECKILKSKSLALQCLLCNFSCTSNMLEAHRVLQSHLTTETHLKRVKFFKFIRADPGVEYDNDVLSSLNLKKLKFSAKICPSLLCNICEVPVPLHESNADQHVAAKTHQEKCQNKKEDTIMKTKSTFDLENCSYYKCFMCDKSFNNVTLVVEHYQNTEHKWKIKALIMIEQCAFTKFCKSNGGEVIACLLCETTICNINSLIKHLSGKKHNEKLKVSITIESSENINVKSTAQVLNSNCTKLTPKKRKTVTPMTLVSATTSPRLNIKPDVNFEASISELIQLGFSIENIQPVFPLELNKIDGLINDLVSLKFSDSQIKKLPSLAKSPSMCKIKNESSSSSSSVLLYGELYIELCIDLGIKNMYNLEYNAQVRLLKLGINLTFPYQCNRACLACGQQFPNNAQSLFEHLKTQQHSKDINKMQLDHKEFHSFPDQFSDFRLGEEYMQDDLCGSIVCYCCNAKLRNKDKVIKQHIEDSVHIQKRKLWKEQSLQLFNECLKTLNDIWYYAEVFFCEICKKRCENELDFVMHLLHPEHVRIVYEFKCKGVAVEYHLCSTCVTFWFGDSYSYEIHCKSDLHKHFAKNKDFMVPDLSNDVTQFLNNLHEHADLMVLQSNSVNLQKDEESVLLKALVETVKPIYPNAKCYIFGLRLSHLAYPKSDIDVFLDCENMHYASSVQEKSQHYVKSVVNYFESVSKIWIVDEALMICRGPIIKLRHIPTSLKCSISFTNGLNVEKSKLLGIYNIAFPMCRNMILLLNKWLTLCRLFGSDCMTTYAISWCVIFYLQQKGFLPSVHKLIKRKNKSKIVDGWQCGYVNKFRAQSSDLTLKQHLKGFFTYYSNFDYQRGIICPYLGEIVDKHTFTCTSKLPTEMDIYRQRLLENEVDIFRFDSPLCIQDPIDHSQNITEFVKKRQLRCFRQYCILSAEKC